MAVSTGKRKRTSGSDYDSSSTSSLDESAGVAEGYEDTFRRHFEARFYPLQNDKNDPAQQRKVRAEGTREESSDEPSDWSGFSSGDDERAPVVYHRNISQLEKPSKSESRSFMDTRPPLSTVKATNIKSTQPQQAEEDKEDRLNLKNDLALHRLISESHLLEDDARVPSANRQKITDTRLKSLGAKKSILEQPNMPMAHRKGIASKAKEREERRRLDARENGIILEKTVRPKKTVDKRLRGVGGPTVGQFKGGMLNLSKRDIASIKGGRR